jgi:hypothetical protein
LIVFAEGGTTNGTHLIKFKKGAFNALKSVSPIITIYKSWFIDIENCVVNLLAQIILGSSCGFGSVVIQQLPNFEPNEYFWKHHLKEGEEKWEAFARVVRYEMAQVGNMKLSDKEIESKYKYREYIYPNHKGKHSD